MTAPEICQARTSICALTAQVMAVTRQRRNRQCWYDGTQPKLQCHSHVKVLTAPVVSSRHRTEPGGGPPARLTKKPGALRGRTNDMSSMAPVVGDTIAKKSCPSIGEFTRKQGLRLPARRVYVGKVFTTQN